ncbi:V4R domain-containing protein [Nodosilinea sp. P-1105]|uniref:V4R domain-containing protein n=1 Tax=Nodosilinea sp. P-1105 TaxID=2546229 RepID=UPI00146B78E6|nr:V4R domain-containing protein [Nodosilinea sp. P-1105]NMF84815.1 4-vinyl reductase [Nodosilinea sp. P-1105]
MVSVADLLIDGRLPGNYFAHDLYVRGSTELGLLENRRGDRLLAIPDPLLQAIYSGLEKETGQASKLVLYNCGRWWGKNFYARFCEELADYYNQPLASLAMVEFLQSLQQCWKTHGWGQITLDVTYRDHGFIGVAIWHSPFTGVAPSSQTPSGDLERGILEIFFSQLTGRELHCVQTSCTTTGDDCNRFILGLKPRLQTVDSLVADGQSHQSIMQALTQQG